MKFKLYETVEATEPLAAAGVCAGDLGVIIEVYGDGSFEADFSPDKEQNILTVAMTERQLRRAPLPVGRRQAA